MRMLRLSNPTLGICLSGGLQAVFLIIYFFQTRRCEIKLLYFKGEVGKLRENSVHLI